LNNVHGLFIVAITWLYGHKIYKLEGIGIVCALLGCIVMMMDPSA
jgi:hypothetical protein